MTHHLAVLKPLYLKRILLGLKTIEYRLSRTRRLPFARVRRGDTLWLKRSGGPVLAWCKVRRVEFHQPQTARQLVGLLTRHSAALQAKRKFFTSHREVRYLTLVHLGTIRKVRPFSIPKTDRRSWVVLTEPPAAGRALKTP